MATPALEVAHKFQISPPPNNKKPPFVEGSPKGVLYNFKQNYLN